MEMQELPSGSSDFLQSAEKTLLNRLMASGRLDNTATVKFENDYDGEISKMLRR